MLPCTSSGASLTFSGGRLFVFNAFRALRLLPFKMSVLYWVGAAGSVSYFGGLRNPACRRMVSFRGEKGWSLETRTVFLAGGEYDIWRREDLRSELDRVDASGNVTLDLSRTTFMDAGAIGLLLALRRRVQQASPRARVTLHKTPAIVRRLLELSHADDLFDFTT